MNKADVLAELHKLYYVKPYDEDEDILRDDLAEAMGFSKSYASQWAREHPDKIESYEVRLSSGKIAKAYRMIA